MKKLLSLILVAIMLVTAMPLAFAEGNTYKVGDIVQFGSYPQSEVKDEALVAELNALAPEWDDWTSYGYYSGEFDNIDAFIDSMDTFEEANYVIEQGDWMRYIDINYEGEKYRGVKFTQYRSMYTTCSSTAANSYQDDYGYITDTIYWFKFEPINWRVVDPSTGFVLCDSILDAQAYSNTIYYNSAESDITYAFFNDASYENYANDYETSSIRQWLNDDFYNTAFTDNEKKKISTTTLNNDSSYTLGGVPGYEKFDSNETQDKIFLLSILDFAKYFRVEDWVSFVTYNEYAASQGVNAFWFVRTPSDMSLGCECILGDGGWKNFVFDVSLGVRPALCFKDIGNFDHDHSYNVVVTNPTCTDKGYTTYTCECGDSYVDDYVDAKGHSYTSEVTIQPTHLTEGVETFACHCGYSYTESMPNLTEHTYTSSVTTQPTHLEEGVRTYICECNDSYTEAVEKLAEHTYNAVVTNPTCTAEGYTTYTCECGDSYIDDFTDVLDHFYTTIIIEPTCTQNGHTVYTCGCGHNYTENIPAKGHSFSGSACTECSYDKAGECSCNCHKGGIAGLIFKIILFFQKLFRTNDVCSCGARHY